MRRVGWGVLALVLLPVLGLTLLLGSQAGSRWALAQVPGLQVQGFNGRLGGAWRAERLVWTQGERRVELVAPQLDWSPGCLLRLTLCLDRVVAGQVILALPPSTDDEEGPGGLPDISLPLSLRLGEVQIGSLLLDGQEELRGLRLAGQWTGEGLRIDSLSVQRDALSLHLQGLLTPTGDWSLKAEGSLSLPAPGEQPWTLAITVDGDLQRELSLHADSNGYLQGRLDGRVSPLIEHLPARLRLVVPRFKANEELPDTLTLEELELTAEGDLSDGYRVLGNARLPAQERPMSLGLSGRVTAEGARIEALDLTASAEQRLALTGELDWREGLIADTHIDWQDFPWRRLYAEIDEPPVALKTFKGDLHYDNGSYLGNFAAELLGPAGPFSLSSPLSGDLEQLNLPSLRLVAGQGNAEGQLNLGFAEGIAWKAALQLDRFDPSYWLAELPGSLAGPLRSEGSLTNGELALNAELRLDGRLRGQTTRLQLAAEGAGERWNLANLDLRVGDNQVRGKGQLDQRLQGQLALDLPRLGQLWPELQGALNGTLDLAGSLAAPQGQLALKGQTLSFGDRRLAALDLAATLDAAQRGTLTLNARDIHSGDTALGDLRLTGQGDRKDQRLDLSLVGPLLRTALGLSGRLDGDGTKGWHWRGQLGKGEVAAGGQTWTLRTPARLERRADGRLELGAHCWAYGDASLCGEEQRLMPEPRLRYHLRNFALEGLAQFLPEDFAWKGKLNADLLLDLPAAGPSGHILVDAGNGTLRVRDGDDWADFPYRQLSLDSQLQPSRVDTQVSFAGGPLGELSLHARIDPRAANKPLRGEFSLSGLDLSVARPFVPMVERLEGYLDGSGTLSGDLQEPRIDGRLQLRGGHVSGAELPTRLENLQAQALIAGENLQLSGDWSAGREGQGSISGSLDWSRALDLDLRIRGDRLPVSVAPYADLEVAPDLQVAFDGEQLALRGKVRVPRGSIIVRELPPSTVKVSADAEIVGADAPVKGASPALRMNVDVAVGEDKLTFSGFGLNAELAGQIHVGDNLDTRGELSLNKGRYRAYGQRLTIRRARLLFTGPIDQPYLDVEAVRVVDDVTAGIRLTGSASAPRSEVFSEPAMSQEQALSYLVLGRPLGGDSGDSNMLAEAALGLGLAQSASITGGLARNLGIENFQLDTEGTGNTTSVVASGSLTDRLSLRYGVGVFEPANTVALRYELTRRLYLEVASGLASSLDLFYKRDF
ncbi:translocation/assembly module TamB [Pseudomonas kuykendallii]|uniref:Translocation and assembly module TamB n=1 Tax=Pseudomonas kuykendallii TaxID=1007099 RepID=A0A1H3DGZ1_9PSED|nr:translocation/assembly module TamB domain-containing protein [Pseudomonas kuykendallii]MCQ4270285.1 translocation/assembly module TamB [Pseudomonas kuykendallii]SDX65627.1 translocation and assembly module TamB [Pseudomonas kuykendallii]